MEDKKRMLIEYMNANVSPILVDFLSGENINEAEIIKSNINKEELTGKYVGENYVAPDWYNNILNKKGHKVLVIDKLDEINKEEQIKFKEILKYRKISTFELPKNCVIMITANKINKDTINEEILSLVAKI